MGAPRGLATMGTAPLQSLQVWFEGVIGRRQRRTHERRSQCPGSGVPSAAPAGIEPP